MRSEETARNKSMGGRSQMHVTLTVMTECDSLDSVIKQHAVLQLHFVQTLPIVPRCTGQTLMQISHMQMWPIRVQLCPFADPSRNMWAGGWSHNDTTRFT